MHDKWLRTMQNAWPASKKMARENLYRREQQPLHPMICVSFLFLLTTGIYAASIGSKLKTGLDATTPFACRRTVQNKTADLFQCLGEIMKSLRVNLKICEGCGNLWFRAQELNEVYCATCSTRLRAFPVPRSRRKPGRPRKHTRTTMHSLNIGGTR